MGLCEASNIFIEPKNQFNLIDVGVYRTIYSTFQSPWKDLPCRPQDIG